MHIDGNKNNNAPMNTMYVPPFVHGQFNNGLIYSNTFYKGRSGSSPLGAIKYLWKMLRKDPVKWKYVEQNAKLMQSEYVLNYYVPMLYIEDENSTKEELEVAAERLSSVKFKIDSIDTIIKIMQALIEEKASNADKFWNSELNKRTERAKKVLLTKCKKNKTMATFLRDPAVAMKWWEEIKDVNEMQTQLRMLKKRTVYRPEIKWAVNHFILSTDFLREWLIGEEEEKIKWGKEFVEYALKIYKSYGINEKSKNLFTNVNNFGELIIGKKFFEVM